MLELWWVRHGETDWNVARRVQGWTDVPLNDHGVRQATTLAAALHGIRFDAIYTSDLLRACKTASILAEHLSVPVHRDERLRERCFGSAEGTSRQIALVHPPEQATDAESDATIEARAASFLHSVRQQHAKGRMICVSHGGYIKALLRFINQPYPGPLENTSITRMQLNDKTWKVLSVNDTQHIGRAHAPTTSSS